MQKPLAIQTCDVPTYRPTRQALQSRVRDYKLLELRLTSIVDFEREKGKLIGEAKNEG